MFADGFVRYVGEPVAAVAADHPETCRRALAAIDVRYDVLTPLIDAEQAISGDRQPIHPNGNVLRHQPIRRGDPDATGDVVVEGTYEIGMQDQAFLGLEAALAIPDHDGHGVELHIATQWLHEDRKQIAACLGAARGAGAAGARRRRGSVRRPRRHQPAGPLLPARASRSAVRCGCSTAGRRASSATSTGTRRGSGCAITPPRDGEVVKIEARFLLDGGAYSSTSSAVLLNAITHTQGPYRCPNAVVEGSSLAPTTSRAGRCAGSAWSRRASPTSRRWTDSRRRAGSIRSRYGCATPADRRHADHRTGLGERGSRRAVHHRDGGTADAGRRRTPTRRCPGRVAPV